NSWCASRGPPASSTLGLTTSFRSRGRSFTREIRPSSRHGGFLPYSRASGVLTFGEPALTFLRVSPKSMLHPESARPSFLRIRLARRPKLALGGAEQRDERVGERCVPIDGDLIVPIVVQRIRPIHRRQRMPRHIAVAVGPTDEQAGPREAHVIAR